MTQLFYSYVRRLFSPSSARIKLGCLVSYAAGFAITVYLGRPMQLDLAMQGLLIVLLFGLTGICLDDFFKTYRLSFRMVADQPNERKIQYETQARYRTALLISSMVLMVSAVLLTMMLMTRKDVTTMLPALVFTFALFAITFKFPPFSTLLANQIELVEAVAVGLLAPAIGFFINYGEYHRLLGILILPLFLLYFAWVFSAGLDSYYQEDPEEGKALIRLVGLKRGLEFHHFLLITAYAGAALSLLVNTPWSLVWPQLLTIPLSAGKIMLLNQLPAGLKPQLKTIGRLSFWTFLIAGYFLVYTLFMN